MDTIVRTRRRTDHAFYLAALVGIFAVVVTGFARTYYLKSWFGTPPLPTLVHLHGALMTSWFVLFFAQVLLVSRRHVTWHRRLGIVGVLLALAILIVGSTVLVRAVARELHAPHGNKGFTLIFGFDIVVLLDFTVLVASAVVLRRRTDWHKRLMLLASCAIVVPAIGRLPVGPLSGFLVFYACVLVPVMVDSVHHRRLHPAFGCGAPALMAAQTAAFFVARSSAWTHFVLRLFA